MINQKDSIRRTNRLEKRTYQGARCEKAEKANTMLYMYIKKKLKNQHQKQQRISAYYFITFFPGK